VSSEARILDFDVETVAAGFADPSWVPQKITCVAWSWMGSDRVESRVCGPMGLYGEEWRRKAMLAPLLEAISQADMVIGHNILRFDLPVINADAMRLGLAPIQSVKCHDTMRLPRSKGFKKGQDNLGHLFRLRNEKMPLDWQQWQDGYNEPDWETIRERAESDVLGHKELYLVLIAADPTSPWGLLKKPTTWRDGR
jgi:DNA polymerase elongation subunit (family B)